MSRFRVQDFNKEEIDLAQAELKKVRFDRELLKILDSMVSVVADEIPVTKLAMQGFGLRATRKWQLETGKKISDLLSPGKEERVAHMKTIVQYFSVEIARAVPKDQHDMIAPAVQKAFAHYQDTILPELLKDQ